MSSYLSSLPRRRLLCFQNSWNRLSSAFEVVDMDTVGVGVGACVGGVCMGVFR